MSELKMCDCKLPFDPTDPHLLPLVCLVYPWPVRSSGDVASLQYVQQCSQPTVHAYFLDQPLVGSDPCGPVDELLLGERQGGMNVHGVGRIQHEPENVILRPAAGGASFGHSC